LGLGSGSPARGRVGKHEREAPRLVRVRARVGVRVRARVRVSVRARVG
jgi:hypothetical protein